MRKLSIAAACAAVVLVSMAAATASAGERTPGPSASTLRPVAEIESGSGSEADRSLAAYAQIAKVLTHPRCTNCHPKGDVPRQNDVMHRHEPPVTRGVDGFGAVGMRCTACHQEKNVDAARVPGAPKWHLAPIEAAWEGVSPGDICRQLKDKDRNGGMTLDQLVKHMGEDELVGWGWSPGSGRTAAPGSQKELGALTAYWVKTGAACPN